MEGLNCTEADVRRVVRDSDKQRFELKEDHNETIIRAVQGHSIESLDEDKILRRLGNESLDQICVHGTYHQYLTGIFKAGGLLAGGTKGQTFRTHVHFASRPPGDKKMISGMRHNAEIAIWIDMKKAIHDELPFFISSNEVILSQGINGMIATKYFSRVQDLCTMKDIEIPRSQEKAEVPM